MTKQVIIGLIGHKGSGKTTVAEHLMKDGFKQVKFASPLKSMCRTFLSELGYNEDFIDRMIEGDLKEKPLEGLKVTPRKLMQTLGTQWGRDCIQKDLWVEIVKMKLQDSINDIVVDDCRFVNEAIALRDSGATLIRIHKTGNYGDGHESEEQMKFISEDFTVYNTGTIEELLVQIDKIMESIYK